MQHEYTLLPRLYYIRTDTEGDPAGPRHREQALWTLLALLLIVVPVCHALTTKKRICTFVVSFCHWHAAGRVSSRATAGETDGYSIEVFKKSVAAHLQHRGDAVR